MIRTGWQQKEGHILYEGSCPEEITVLPCYRRGCVMFVCDVLEVVRAVLWYEQRDGDGFDGRVSPATIVDSACLVDVVDIVAVLGRPPHVEVRNLEVIPEYEAVWTLELGCNGALVHVVSNGGPQTDDARSRLGLETMIAVLDMAITHQPEDVVADRFYNIRVVVQSPYILKSGKDRLLVYSLGLEPTHVPITNSLRADTFRHR